MNQQKTLPADETAVLAAMFTPGRHADLGGQYLELRTLQKEFGKAPLKRRLADLSQRGFIRFMGGHGETRRVRLTTTGYLYAIDKTRPA